MKIEHSSYATCSKSSANFDLCYFYIRMSESLSNLVACELNSSVLMSSVLLLFFFFLRSHSNICGIRGAVKLRKTATVKKKKMRHMRLTIWQIKSTLIYVQNYFFLSFPTWIQEFSSFYHALTPMLGWICVHVHMMCHHKN